MNNNNLHSIPNELSAEGYGRFWLQDMENINILDLLRSISDGAIIPLVDDEAGGIIAYILMGNENSLMAHITGR